MAEQAPLAPEAAGAIHDIGYRHHDGERLGRGYIRRSLAVDSLRAAFGLGRSTRSKVVPAILLGVMCLPALVIIAGTAITGADELLAGYASYQFNMQVVISIFVAAQAPVLVSRDLRFGQMALYLSRPMERRDYVVAKVLAMTGALLVLMGLPLLILLLGALVVGLPPGEQLPDLARALAGTALLAGLLAGTSLLIAALTPRRGFAVAAIITVLIVLAAVQGIGQGVAIEAGAGEGATYLGLLSPYTLVEGVQSGLLGAPTELPVPSGAGGALFLLTGLLVVGASVAALLARYRSVSIS